MKLITMTAHFIFKAKKPSGQIYSSERDAADRYELYRMIRENGDELVSADEKNIGHKLNVNLSLGRLTGGIKMIEKINFARNLGAMLKAGLSLSRSLSVIERQSRNKKFKVIMNGLIGEVSKGVTLSDALAKYPKIFSPLFVSMVHAGEQSGTMAESLRVIAAQMDSAYALERRIRGALLYPCVILFVMVVIGILMFIFVVPTLMKTFTDLNVQLPFTTRIVLGVSSVIQNQGLLVLVSFIAIVVGIYLWSRGLTGKKILHRAVLKIPIVGILIQEVNAARTARTLSSLLTSGVDVVESVSITAGVVQNVHFRAVLEQARDAIKKGDLMSKIFSEYTNLYPIFLAEMMSVGEETGKIGEMLGGVALYYEEDVEQKTKNMSTVIEPFLMIVIGAAVGFFAVAMISPMYSLVNAI